tara:strand:+ start:122 stop:634 length:513 start_codon:yes stop_codon:yes gene_type:complete
MVIDLYDNFLPDWLHQTALMIVKSDSTLWQCTKILNEDKLNVPTQYNRQLTHRITHESGIGNENSTLYHAVLLPIFEKLGISTKKIIRSKINNNLASQEIREHGFHVDTNKECNVLIYYFNTNNGYTLFENGDKVESVANRLIKFKSNLRHTGTTCTDQPNRYVLNVNYN